jgi:hypothetical protein
MLFAIGLILLKLWRPHLRREPRTSLLRCVVCLLAVLAGLVGFVVLRPAILLIAGLYFVCASALVGVVIYATKLLRAAHWLVSCLCCACCCSQLRARLQLGIQAQVHSTSSLLCCAPPRSLARLLHICCLSTCVRARFWTSSGKL